MLEVSGLNAAYGRAQILFDLSFEARAGEVAVLLGRSYLLAGNAAQLVDRVADKLLGGAISAALRGEAIAMAERSPASASVGRVAEVIHTIVTSPEYVVQR